MDQPTPEPDLLAFAKDEEASRVAFCLKHIADHGYQPTEPGKPWHGRDETVSSLQSAFGIDDALTAASLVNVAVTLLWSQNRPDDRQVQKQLMLERLAGYRRYCLQMMKEGQKETTWKWEDREDPKTGDVRPTKVKFKQKKIGVGLAAISRVLEIEALEAKLRGLEESIGDGSSSIEVIIKQLDGMAEGEAKRQVVTSVAQTIKLMPTDKLNAAGKAKVEAMLASVQQRKAKKIESKVKEPEKGEE